MLAATIGRRTAQSELTRENRYPTCRRYRPVPSSGVFLQPFAVPANLNMWPTMRSQPKPLSDDTESAVLKHIELSAVIPRQARRRWTRRRWLEVTCSSNVYYRSTVGMCHYNRGILEGLAALLTPAAKSKLKRMPLMSTN